MTSSASDPKEQRVVITGASGLIGSALVTSLRKQGHPVTPLVRRSPKAGEAQWDPANGTIDSAAIDGAWAVVHLAGEGIADTKWTEAHKERVLQSRVAGTTLIAHAIATAANKPSVFASGSAIGFYGSQGSTQLTEQSATGSGFLAEVVRQWEACAKEATDAGVRTALLRTGIVLSSKGGALKPQLLPFKLGLGGRIGPGTQYLPWISLVDQVRAIEHVLRTPSISGPVNLTAPNPATNSEFTKALGAAVKRPTLLPTPLFPIKLMFGPEMVEEMLLSSARVLPKVLQDSGFVFEHPQLKEALTAALAD